MKLKALLASATFALIGLGNQASAEQYDITVMPFGLSEYMANWVDEIQKHPLVQDGTIKITVLDGKFDAATQGNQMDTVITQKADAVIFAPIDSDAAVAPIERAVAAGIPVITSVTGANTDKMYGDIVTDNVEGGKLITTEIVKMMGGKGNVVVQEGPIGNSPQIMRRKGIDEVLAANPDVQLLAAKTANWSRAEGLANMENWLSLYGDQINGVIAENDEMALGSIQALEAKGFTTDQIKVVSIDGINDGLRAAKEGKLFTLYKPAHMEGQGAVDLAMSAIVGESYEPKADFWGKDMEWKDGTAKAYTVPWLPVTAENAEGLMKK